MKHITTLNASSEKIELEPFGLTAGADQSRPVMLFREKGGEAVLPVWLSPLDAGIALTQHNVHTYAMSPHDVTLQALNILGVKAETCDFIEVKGHQQYAKLTFSGSRKLKTLRARADHAVSFCLQAKVKFYCTRGYLERCRDVNAEINRMQMSPQSRAETRRPRSTYLN
jgi:bifunctional DNase/RNase